VGGLSLVLAAIAFITLIHAIEAYVLNPRIMGAHLHINPVLVLAILVISHHLFHVWGLILGVPIVTYFFTHAIRFRTEAPAVEERAA
jgi:predicted PurR-regulated permease PerM